MIVNMENKDTPALAQAALAWGGQKEDTQSTSVSATLMDKCVVESWRAGKDGICGGKMEENMKPKGFVSTLWRKMEVNVIEEQVDRRRPW